MGANNSNIKYHQNICNTPPKDNHRFLFDPRSPSGKRIFQINYKFSFLLRWNFSNTNSD